MTPQAYPEKSSLKIFTEGKKSLMFVGLFLILSLSLGVFVSSEVCTDTDPNNDPLVKGYVNYTLSDGNNQVSEDFCDFDNEKLLKEYSCDDPSQVTEYFCGENSICSNGKCVEWYTETITCKFVDPDTKESLENFHGNCFDSFSYGNIEIPTEEVLREDGKGTYTTQLQYQCDNNNGECSITVSGEKGSKIKWGSFCFEFLSDSGKKRYLDLISNPNLITTIDGTDKTIEIDCISPQTAIDSIIQIFPKLWNLFRGIIQLSPEQTGYRDSYVLCYDGTAYFEDNDAPTCNPLKTDNSRDEFADLCKNKCSIEIEECIENTCNEFYDIRNQGYDLSEETNDMSCSEVCAFISGRGDCGVARATVANICDVQNPNKEFIDSGIQYRDLLGLRE